ncbi:Apolipophorin [Stylophora pistillata]|uniref:Apolipophorin n=1 Tax=Stylophora pistillata TaxID=50429 RepID=A0A2B4SDY5_STYPI|nr:Apolipophorin [Stylophora pistillata]
MRSILFVLLATGAFAAPTSLHGERPPECDKRSNRFHHLKEFPYNYEGESISSVAGSSSARSGLKIRARCVVKSIAPCQHVLKIDTVELWEAQSKNPGPLDYQISQGSTAFAEELQAQDLVFRMDAGRITEILAHPEEPSHVLNIKRGILSALQVQFVEDHATLEEDDVVGRCKARYEIKSRHLSRRPKIVYKTRNLTECTDRAQTDIGIHVHSYEEKPISLLHSNSTCKLYLTAKKRTQKVVCEEDHLFRPFSGGYKNASGAITKIRQVLELQSILTASETAVPLERLRPVSLRYAHAQPQSNQEAITDAFYWASRLSKESKQSTKPESAQHFSNLVFSIRKLSTPAMETLWQKIHNEEDPKMREYFYDALPHCGTGGCAKVMSNAIRKKLVNHERGNMFLAGLAMAGNPTKETVEHVLELCEENPGRTAMLTLGTLIHIVCESKPQECNDQDPENPITKAENFFLSRLGQECKGKTPEDFENFIITLKAIGNAGRPLKAENVLLNCAWNLEAPVNMSIAALEALRRLPCSKKMTDQVLQIYGEFNVDVEIRIAAYLALTKCPSPEVFRSIAEILKNEVNNQVGSFVWSHMTNAMDSTEPVHGLPQAEMMKDALNGMKLREFNLNRLRFSRAWEGSFYSDVLRFGGSAQSHLIYHPTSFFPRSAMVNVTVDVLGTSINVLEAGARFEGFEILIEQFFGEDGYFPDDRIMQMFNLKPHEERDKEEKTVKTWKLKQKRSLNEDLNKVENHLNKLHHMMDNRKHHPSGAVSVKMFGNELRLLSFDDISWLNDEVDKINVIDILIALAKGGKKSFSKSMMFLDAKTTVPTILGLPLKMSAKGTTVASVELAGKFDIRNMFWGKMRFDIRGHVKPSAIVDVSGRMGVSAVYAEAGVLVNSSLYTVTHLKGNASYAQGEILKFELGVPEEPVQFVNVSSSLFVTLNDEKLAIEGAPRRIEPAPCLNLTRVLGLTFCSQLSVPLAYRDYESPYFPFSGPSSFSISMTRTDPKLTKYQLIAERLQTEDDNKYDVIAVISTPGATWERNLEANGTMWFKKDGKLFSVSTAALGLNFGKFKATYNNKTHAVNLTYSGKDAVYGHPIVVNGHFFNNSGVDSPYRDMGFQLSASYSNYTITQLTKLYNHSNAYGYVSNLTYWPGKYMFSTGEVNVPKKSISFLANHTCTQTKISFNGKLGEEEDDFVFSFSNKPTKAGIELTGRHLKAQKEGVLRLFARPCQQSFTLRGSYLEAGQEKGIQFTGTHENKNRVISWYTGIVNSTNERSLKINGTVLGSKAEAVWSYLNLTQSKAVKFQGLLLNQSVDAVWSYVNAGQEQGLRFNATGLNKTLEAALTYLNLTNDQSLKFNATALNKTIEAVWSYVNLTTEKGMRLKVLALNHTIQSVLTFHNLTQEKSIKFNATALNKTLEAMWTYVNVGKEKELRMNVTALNKTAEIIWSYFHFGDRKGVRFNVSALNRTARASWTVINRHTARSLEFEAAALNKTVNATWTLVNLRNEKSLKFNASFGNKTINSFWTFLNLEHQKSLKFNASCGKKNYNATWTFLNLGPEKTLRFESHCGNRTMNSSLTFLNMQNEKSVKFQAIAFNKSIASSWIFASVKDKKSLNFKASALNKTIDAAWIFLNLANEKSLKFKASAENQTINSSWTFLDFPNEKKLIFNASALNKTMNATWTLLSTDKQKNLKLDASLANKNVKSTWTLVNLRTEKSLLFSGSALNKTVEASWTFFNLTSEKGLKFKANCLNNTLETTLSFLNFARERSLKFNVSAMNKTVETAWTFVNLTNEKFIKFNATGFNRTAETIFSYTFDGKQRSIKFNASAMNKTIEVGSSFVKIGEERAIKFHACTSNKTVKAVWSYLRGEYAHSIKFNASAMNKTVEATWSYVRSDDERAIKFHAAASNRTVEAIWSLRKSDHQDSFKFNASVMNRTVEAAWSYYRDEKERSIKFHASTLNKTVEAVWSYLKNENELSIKFNASVVNQSMEAIWTLLNSEAEKGLKFNVAVKNKTLNTTFVYFRNPSNLGVLLNVSSCNKSVSLLSKVFLLGTNKKVILQAAYQNYSVALVGFFKNLTSQKTACIYPEYLGRSHGKICAVFSNSSVEKSMSLNLTVLNRTGELKTQWFKNPTETANRLTAKFNKTVFFESWMSYMHPTELKSIHFNTTIVNRSADATFYFRNGSEKAIGFNATVLKKHVGFEGVWLNGKILKEAAVHLFWNKSTLAKSSLMFLNNTQRKVLQYRAQLGRFVAEWEGAYVTQRPGVKELLTFRMLRNGSQSIFLDSAKLIYTKTDKTHELGYQYNLRAMGYSFEHGWDASYYNYSNTEDSYHEGRFAVIYSKGKKVSVTGVFRNTSKELSNTLVVEYQPDKTVTQSLIWYKQRKSVNLRVELIPSKPFTWTTTWNRNNGFSFNSVLDVLGKKIENQFDLNRKTGNYEGHFEIFPVYPLTVRGVFTQDRGLYFTTEISAFKRTWNHMIDFIEEDRKLAISVDVLPGTPVDFEANWKSMDDMGIAVNLKGFEKSLRVVCDYDKLTKTFTSGLTIFKQTLTLTEKLDTETRSLFLTFSAFNRTAGFTGRFDWKNYVASTFVSYQNNKVGWFIKFNPASRSIVFNVTVTPRISGQVVGEMPNANRLQVTIQRKLGENVANESRLMYILNSEASLISFTWNTSAVATLVNQAQVFKTLLRNVTVRFYNLTVLMTKNLTKEVEGLVKKLEAKIKPTVLKIYAEYKTYNYKGLMQNITSVAHNMSLRLLNITLRSLNNTINNLTRMIGSANFTHIIGNASEFYNTIHQNATVAYRRLRREVLPPIIGNITIHLQNISRDLQGWAKNLSLMANSVMVRGERVGDIAKRVSQRVQIITAQLVERVQIKTRELIVRLREVELRGKKLGPIYDQYMLEMKKFTCNFNASCSLRNVTIFAKNLTTSVRNITVFNKTIEEHFKLLNKTFLQNFEQLNKTLRPKVEVLFKKACLLRQTALNFTNNLTRILPKLMTNVTLQAIHLAKNLTKEFRNITIQAFEVMYKVRNITIRRVPIGQVMDKAVLVSLNIASEALKLVNHTVYTNISALIAFIRHNSQKSAEEILDLTIEKGMKFFNLSKMILNESLSLGLNLSRRAILVYNSSAMILNKTLQKLLKMRPDELVNLSIEKLQMIAKNVTAEVLNIIKQLRAIDVSGKIKAAWAKMDVIAKLEALQITAKWKQLVEFIRAFNIKERALLVRDFIGNASLKIEKELRDILNLANRVLTLATDLVNMKVSREVFVKEVISLAKESRRVFTKYGIMAKNTSLHWESKLRNVSYEMACLYRNITVNRTLAAYNILKKHSLVLYNEHQQEGLRLYTLYKNLLLKIYEDFKANVIQGIGIQREKLLSELNVLITKARKLENMTYEEIVTKSYEFLSKHGLAIYSNITVPALNLYSNISTHALQFYGNATFHAVRLYNNFTAHGLRLYKNATLRARQLYSNFTLHAVQVYKNVTAHALKLYENATVIAIKFYNETKNVTLRALNLTLVLVNRTKMMVLQYYNATLNLTIHYYNMGRNYSLQYYNLTRNLSLQYLLKHSNLARNLTLHVYNVTRNITIQAYNKTRALVLQGIRYINLTVVPLVKANFIQGKVLVLRYADGAVYFVQSTAQAMKKWYSENKEKTLEELYFEAFDLAERKFLENRVFLANKYEEFKEIVEDRIREKINDAKVRFTAKFEEWKKELHKLNKTVINITGEAIALYNQTANITFITAKELVAIFHPYVKVMANKTVFYLIKAKNISLPLLEKAANITSLALNQTLELLNETRQQLRKSYTKFMALEDVQRLIQKHQLKQRYVMVEKFVLERYDEIVEFLKAMKPKVEAKVKEAIFYLNVTLPAEIKGRCAMMKNRYDEIKKEIQSLLADPQMQLEKALAKAQTAIKGTSIESIVHHERVQELTEDLRNQELIVSCRGVVKNISVNLGKAVELASEKVKELMENLKTKAEVMADKIKTKMQETRQTLIVKFEDFKTMKLREIVEHNSVFKTIELAKNVSLQIRNMTLEAKNMTSKFVAIGKVYYRNITAKVENYTRILKAKVQNYTRFLRERVQNYTKIVQVTVQNYTDVLNATFQNYTKILNATFQNYTRMLNATIRNYTTILTSHLKNYTVILKGHYERIYASHFVSLHRNYTLLIKKYKALALDCIGRCKNLTLRGIAISRNWTAASVTFTRVWINRTLQEGMKYYRQELERGMRYYREEVKPLYFNKVLPFYKDTVLPAYHNYSKLVTILQRNITKTALELKDSVMGLKERVINVSRQAFQVALDIDSCPVLRAFGKMTFRESVLKGRVLCTRAYNYTLNMTRLAVNLTVETFNIARARLACALNTTMAAINSTLLNSKPLLRFFNDTRAEVIETAAFVTKYYGIDDAVKARMRRSLEFTRNVTMDVVNRHGQYLRGKVQMTIEFVNSSLQTVNAPRFIKASTLTALKFVNTTMRYVNRTIGYLNATFVDVTHRLNKTVHFARSIITKKILDTRVAMNKTVQDFHVAVNRTITKALVSIRNARIAINKTITNAYIAIRNASVTIGKTITDFRLALPKYIQVTEHGVTVVIPRFDGKIKTLALASVEKIKILKQDFLVKMQFLRETTPVKVEALKQQFLAKIESLKQNGVIKIQSIRREVLEKMEKLKQEVPDRIRLLKQQSAVKIAMLKQMAVEKYNELKQNVIVKYGELRQNAVEKLTELKVKARIMSGRAKTISKAWVAVTLNKTVFYQQKAYGYVMKVYNLTKNHLTEKYINITLHFLNVTRDLAVFYRQQTYRFVINAYNLGKNHPLTQKYANTTVHYLNISRKLATVYRHKMVRLLRNIYRRTRYHPVTVRYLHKSAHYFNITRNFLSGLNMTLVKNVTSQYASRALNLSRQCYNVTNRYLSRALNLSRHCYNVTLSRALNLSHHYYNATNKYVSRALNLSRQWYNVCMDRTLNISVQVYKVAQNVTLDILNSSCPSEALGKAMSYSKIAINATVKLYRKTLRQASNCSATAYNQTIELFHDAKNFSTMAVNNTVKLYRQGLLKAKNLSMLALNKTVKIYQQALLMARNYSTVAVNRTLRLCHRLYNKTVLVVYNTTFMKTYIPMALNLSRQCYGITKNFTVEVYEVAVNVTLDIYNSTCLVEAFGKTKNYSRVAFNETLKLYSTALGHAVKYSTIALNKTAKLYQEALAQTRNYSVSALNKTMKIYQRVFNRTVQAIYNTTVMKKYLPIALNFTRHWCSVGFNMTRNFTAGVYGVVQNVTLDVCNSSSLPELYGKVRNYSRIAFDQTMRMCLELYGEAYNLTSQRYAELRNYTLTLYEAIIQHEKTVLYLNHAHRYLYHTKKMISTRVRSLHGAKRYWQKRMNHRVSQMSYALNPINWIPPFNSTAMIFGGPHVYTFDGTYYKFPGYRKPGCMYVLARDVRDNKFTILSQETAIIVLTEDSSVKIYQDGRVETIVKVSPSGNKVSDGYHSELPVESFNTTVQRQGSFIVFRHDMGLEIVCDVEHYLCTFNIARWFHGRMAGLLGTNNNEFHDEMMTINNTPAK